MEPNSSQLINSMLVPGIMIVATAILLISANEKYSNIVSRIRRLKESKSQIQLSGKNANEDGKQIDIIELQLSHLIHRISMVRITIVSFSSAVLLFTVSAVLIGIRPNVNINGYFWVALGFFFGGLMAIINGIVFSVIEVFKGYRIVHIEISENLANRRVKKQKTDIA